MKNSVKLRVSGGNWISCDRFGCMGCGSEVLTGFAQNQFGEHLSAAQFRALRNQDPPTEFYQHHSLGEVKTPVDYSDSERVAEQPGPF